MALLVVQRAHSEFSAEQRAELWDTYSELLDTTLRRGCRKEQKARLKDTFEGTQAAFIAEVNKKTEKSVAERLKLIQARIVDVGA